MELKKANLHMDQVKCRLNTQITLEEDKNISDRNPDAERILMERGRVVIEELRPAADSLFMKGKLVYEILYSSDDESSGLYRMQGEIPWEEKVRAEGMETIDNPQVQARIEDLRSSLINSRKINIRSLVNFCIKTREIRDEEILLDVEDMENMEIKKEPYSQSVIVADKKDVFRIKEDLELPASLPPIGEVLWKYLDLGRWEVKPLEDKIGIQGEVGVFILYESAEEEPQVKAYETTIPFSGNIECPGTESCMIADITPSINYQNLSVKQDYDGEDRMIDVEMVLDIPIQIYENRDMEQVTDVYGTSMEITPEYSTRVCKVVQDKYQGKNKIVETLKIPASSGKILQVCHTCASVLVEESKIENSGLRMEGILSVTIFYITDDERRKYEVLKKDIPFSYLMENLNVSERCKWNIHQKTEQCDTVILDENNVEIKATVGFEVLLEEWKERNAIHNIRIKPYEEEAVNNAPGMIVYIPSKKENIWEIGKRYQISQESIKEMNQLSGTEVERGQKILLVRGNG